MLCPKAPASCDKKFWKTFLEHYTSSTSICMNPKSVSQVFKTLFQTRGDHIFVHHGVFFSRHVQMKSSFSDKKTSAVKSGTPFRETIEN